jgi:hypothetical protein
MLRGLALTKGRTGDVAPKRELPGEGDAGICVLTDKRITKIPRALDSYLALLFEYRAKY